VIPTLRWTAAAAVARSVAAACERVVIVDNGCGELRAPFGNVATVRPQANVGFGAAVMLGNEEAAEDVLLVLNDDLEPRAGFVEAISAPFSDPAVHSVAARLLAPSGAVDTIGLAVDRSLRATDVTELAASHRVIGPSGAAAAYRRATFVELGGFAPELFAYWEDVDVALQLWRTGRACRFAHDAVAVHRRGTSLGGRSQRQRELDAFGRGFILGRYRAWMSPVDRACVPLVDWPSLASSCIKLRSTSPLRERARGCRAGRQRPAEGDRRGRPATVSIRDTFRSLGR